VAWFIMFGIPSFIMLSIAFRLRKRISKSTPEGDADTLGETNEAEEIEEDASTGASPDASDDGRANGSSAEGECSEENLTSEISDIISTFEKQDILKYERRIKTAEALIEQSTSENEKERIQMAKQEMEAGLIQKISENVVKYTELIAATEALKLRRREIEIQEMTIEGRIRVEEECSDENIERILEKLKENLQIVKDCLEKIDKTIQTADSEIEFFKQHAGAAKNLPKKLCEELGHPNTEKKPVPTHGEYRDVLWCRNCGREVRPSEIGAT